MCAYRIERQGPAEYRFNNVVDLPVPEPGPGEVRVRVLACGVCHTDLHEVEGDIAPRLPVVPGHETVGTVDKLGDGVTAPALGSRVGIPWLRSTCGKCRFCLSGRENLCDDIRFNGFDADGGYAEYTVAPAAFVYPLPGTLDPASAAPLLCAGVIGLRALRIAGVHHRDTKTQSVGRAGPQTSWSLPEASGLGGEVRRLGLYGFGASAHICLQVARHFGIETAVFTRSEAHRAHALELGAAWTGSADDGPPWPLDSGIIFAPAGELVPIALGHVDKGGTLALAGIHMTPLPQMDYSLVYGERVLCSVANSTRQDVRDLLALAAAIPLRTTVQTFPLEAASDALLAVKHSETRGAAVLVPPR
jgi:propanol-preferring alcohol dehydrogenase